MGLGDIGLDPKTVGLGATPTDHHLLGCGGQYRDAARFDDPGNSHGLSRGICENCRGFTLSPPPNHGLAAMARNGFLDHVRIGDCRRHTDAQIIEPSVHRFIAHAVVDRELCAVTAAGRFRLRSGGKRTRRLGKNHRAPTLEVVANFTHVAQQQIRPSGRNDPRPIPHHGIVLASVARIRGGQINRDLTLGVGWG